MNRLVSAAALALILPFSALAQGDAAQLREEVASSAIMHELNADVAAMTDEQVMQAYEVLEDATKTDEQKKEELEALFATDKPM